MGRGTCACDRSAARAGARPRRRGRWLSSSAPATAWPGAQGPLKPVPDLLGRVGDAWRRLLLGVTLARMNDGPPRAVAAAVASRNASAPVTAAVEP